MLTRQRRLDERTIDSGDDHAEALGRQRLAQHRGKIIRFAEIEVLHICAVVEVAEHVVVIEAYLHVDAVSALYYVCQWLHDCCVRKCIALMCDKVTHILRIGETLRRSACSRAAGVAFRDKRLLIVVFRCF